MIAVNSANVMEVDHDARQIYVETMQVQPQVPDISMLAPTDDQVAARLTSPIVTTYIDTEKISFERWVLIVVVLYACCRMGAEIIHFSN